jgi:hypothetical protein
MKTFSLVLCILVFTNSLFSQEIEKKSNRDSKFQLSISSGASFRIAKIDKSVNEIYRNQIKNLKSGWNYDFNFIYKISKTGGVGAKYNTFKSNYTSQPLTFTYPDNSSFDSSLSSSQKITFIGPVYQFGTEKNNNSLCSSFYIGHVNYSDIESTILGKTKQSASSLGIGFDYIYYFGLNKNFQIGPKIAFFSSAFSKYKLTYPDGSSKIVKLENGQSESLARLDFSVALRYKL